MKKITCSGASGFLGKELVKRFVSEGYKVKALGHSEYKTALGNKDADWYIGDITDEKFCEKHITGDIVIHTAAQKHIPIAEKQPEFAIKNNILGTLNVFRAAINNHVKEVVFISTDKAYKPETIYGKTKEVCEWLCKYYNAKNLGTSFYWCRYGNVGGSSGSVFEIWDKLGKEGKTLELTVPEMTRFFFTIGEAVETVIATLERKDKENAFIPEMKAMLMSDVADVFSDYYGVDVKVVGNRGNEKLHEGMSDSYNSSTCERFTKEEIRQFLLNIGLLKK